MPESYEVEAVIPAGPERVYAAWLDTKEHGAFTGAPALVEPWVGGRFTAHDGYLHGITLQLEPGKRIVQQWRSTEFPQGTQDSRIYIDFTPVDGGTRIHIKHVDVPTGQAKVYKPGWVKHYFKSMIQYFAAKPTKGGRTAKAAVALLKTSPRPEKPPAPPAREAARAIPKPVAAPAKQPSVAAKAKRSAPSRPAQRTAKPERPAGRKPIKRAAPKRPAKLSAKPAKSKSSSRKAARKSSR